MQTEVIIRTPGRDEGSAILKVANSTPLFTPEEVKCVSELWDEFIHDASKEDNYYFLAAYLEDQLSGFACYGHRALTQSAYDLYWIAVDFARQNLGIGKQLLRAVEQEVIKLGGSMLIAETSANQDYAGTRQFYFNMGYEKAGEIADFYQPGDGMVLFVKPLNR